MLAWIDMVGALWAIFRLMQIHGSPEAQETPDFLSATVEKLATLPPHLLPPSRSNVRHTSLGWMEWLIAIRSSLSR